MKKFQLSEIQSFINQYSINKDTSLSILASLEPVIGGIKELKTEFNDLPYTIIAGGAIRDLVFGVYANDIDVFLDTTEYSKEEEDDILCLMSNSLGSMPSYKREVPDYTGQDSTPFTVYETSLTEEFAFMPVQFVGRQDGDLRYDPLNFVESKFDWSLTKSYFDIETNEFVFSDEFLAQLKDKSALKYDGSNAKVTNRVHNFWYKFPPTRKYFTHLVDTSIKKERVKGFDWIKANSHKLSVR